MAEEYLSTIPDLETTIDSSSDEGSPDLHLCPIYLVEDLEDIMSYPYSKYNDEADVEAHVRVFLTTWHANDVFQRLSLVDADALKIADFGLSLEGQSNNWYSHHKQGEFELFQQLTDKFVRLFHRQVA